MVRKRFSTSSILIRTFSGSVNSRCRDARTDEILGSMASRVLMVEPHNLVPRVD